MKTMKCSELGGACEQEFSGDTFEEIASQSQQHGMAMFQQEDEAHLIAMAKMKDLMTEPDALQKWMNDRRAEFDALPDE